jgi:hypothetical protein
MAVIDGDLSYRGNGHCTLCDKPFSLNDSAITYNNFLACGKCLPAFLRSFIKDYRRLCGCEWVFTPTKRAIEVAEDLENLAKVWRKWHEIYGPYYDPYPDSYPTELPAVPSEAGGIQSPSS